jgi:type I restriction enzyme S subunit
MKQTSVPNTDNNSKSQLSKKSDGSNSSKWQYCNLEEVVSKELSNISLNKIKNEDGIYPVFGAQGFVQNVSFYHQEKEYLSIIKDGAGIGRITKHPEKSSIVATMQYLLPKDGFDIDFIKYFLEGVDFIKYKNGSTIPHIYFKDYKFEQFPKISLSEQKAIVAVLDESFGEIEKVKANTEQNLKNAKELFQSYLQGVFENKGADWEESTLGEVCEIRSGRNQKEVEDPKGLYPILGSAGKIMGYANKFICEEGTTIIGRKGTIDKPIFIEDKFWNVDTAFGLHALKELDKRFLFYFCKSYDFTKQDKGSGRPSLVKSDLLQINVPFPPLSDQQTIVRQLDALRAETQKLEAIYTQKLSDLEELKKSILQKAFSGEL